MFSIKILFLLVLLSSIVDILVNSAKVNQSEGVEKYFGSAIVQECQAQWQLYRKAIEAAIEKDIIEHSKIKILNVFNKEVYSLEHLPYVPVTRGFLIDDGVTTVLFRELKIKEFPSFYFPKLTIGLPLHIFRMETALRRFTVHGTFLNFRKKNRVVVDDIANFDPAKTSPFALYQVGAAGSVAIEVEACQMIVLGIMQAYEGIVTLSHTETRLSDCRMGVELNNLQQRDAPPVFAPYFDDAQSRQLETLIATALHDQTNTLLQTSLFTYINMSSILGEVPFNNYRTKQRDLFLRSSYFFLELFSKMNDIANKQKQQGVITLPPFSVAADYGPSGENKLRGFSIQDVNVFGINTAFPTLTGGPYKLQNIRSLDGIKFKTLQVTGRATFQMERALNLNFSVDIPDLSATLILKEGYLQQLRSFVYSGRRFTCNVRWNYNKNEESKIKFIDKLVGTHAVIGYLINTLPDAAVEKLSSLLKLALETTDYRSVYRNL